jgi:uncharacterized repeat protein (TIGR02543 family)
MFCKRATMCLLFVVLLFIPMLSSASQSIPRDIPDTGDETLNRLLLDARQNELQQEMPGAEIITAGIIVKTFIAYDSIHNRYLLVYLKRAYDPDIGSCYRLDGQLAGHTGELLGDPFEISSGGYFCTDVSYWSYLRADVAFDRANRHFLVVWPDFRNGRSEIFGQFIACDGSLIGAEEGNDPNFRISSNAYGAGVADLAFDPRKKRFLVAWTNYNGEVYYASDGDICARFIDSSSPLSPLSGSEEFIVAPSTTQQASPAVAFDRHNRNFLVVWYDYDETGSLVKGQMLDDKGMRLGVTNGGFDISEGSHINGIHAFSQPEVGWESRSHRFLVAWTQINRDGYQRIYGHIVNPNGSLFYKPGRQGNIVIADNTIYQSTPFNINPNVKFDRISGNFLVVYTNQDPIYGQYIAPDGALVGTSAEENFLIGDRGYGSTFNKPGIAFNSRCGNFMVCWSELEYMKLANTGNGGCANVPVVKTGEISNITGVSASCIGQVALDGGLDVTARGFCWGTEPEPGLQGSHTVEGSGLGSFESVITALSPNTTYYVRAYATSIGGTGFGAQKTFTTPSVFDIIFGSQNGGSVKGKLSQSVQFGNAASVVEARAHKGFFFTGWTGDSGFGFTMANPLTVNEVTADMTITAGFSPIGLRGERIVARGQALKNHIGEIDITTNSIDPTLPLTFKLYRSINGVGRQLISQFTAEDLADGHHHILDPTLDSRNNYLYTIEIQTNHGAKAGYSLSLTL